MKDELQRVIEKAKEYVYYCSPRIKILIRKAALNKKTLLVFFGILFFSIGFAFINSYILNRPETRKGSFKSDHDIQRTTHKRYAHNKKCFSKTEYDTRSTKTKSPRDIK